MLLGNSLLTLNKPRVLHGTGDIIALGILTNFTSTSSVRVALSLLKDFVIFAISSGDT